MFNECMVNHTFKCVYINNIYIYMYTHSRRLDLGGHLRDVVGKLRLLGLGLGHLLIAVGLLGGLGHICIYRPICRYVNVYKCICI